eukprot:4405099-Pyramimonas_sp.AAC.1
MLRRRLQHSGHGVDARLAAARPVAFEIAEHVGQSATSEKFGAPKSALPVQTRLAPRAPHRQDLTRGSGRLALSSIGPET